MTPGPSRSRRRGVQSAPTAGPTFTVGQPVAFWLAPEGIGQVEDLHRSNVTVRYLREGRLCRCRVSARRLAAHQQAYPLLPFELEPNPLGLAVPQPSRQKTFDGPRRRRRSAAGPETQTSLGDPMATKQLTVRKYVEVDVDVDISEAVDEAVGDAVEQLHRCQFTPLSIDHAIIAVLRARSFDQVVAALLGLAASDPLTREVREKLSHLRDQAARETVAK